MTIALRRTIETSGGGSIDYVALKVLYDAIPTPTDTPTPTPTNTPTLTPTGVPTPTPTPVLRQMTILTPAKVWIGLQNILSIGTRLDLLAEVYQDSVLISSGQVNSFYSGIGIGGVLGARLATIPFEDFVPIDFPEGSNLKMKLSVRNACNGSDRNFGVSRLWYNDNKANSRFGAEIGESINDYFLRENFVLETVSGLGRRHIDVRVGERCGVFRPFGVWVVAS